MFSFLKLTKPNDVFTPASIAQRNYLKRDYLIKRLESYLMTPGKQLIVYGYSGSGKTTLIINELNRLKIPFIKSHCSSDSTYSTLVLSGFDALDLYYTKSYSTQSRTSLEIEYKQIKGVIESSTAESLERIVPPQLTAEKLATFFGAVGCVWLIEDFHKLMPEEKKKIADTLKIFVDNSNLYPQTKVICLGAVTSSRELIELDPNLGNRLADINVPLLTDDEISSIIWAGFKLLGVRIDNILQERLVKLSNNIGSIAHQLCLNICAVLKIKHKNIFRHKIAKESTIDDGIKMYVEEQAGRFQLSLDKIFAIPNRIGEKIIKALVNSSIEGLKMEQIVSKVGKPSDEVEKVVVELCSNKFEEVVRYNEYSTRFQISNSFFTAFVKLYLESKKKKKNRTNSIFINFNSLSEKRIDEYFKIMSNIIQSRGLDISDISDDFD